MQAFLNSGQNYPLLKGQANLFKCFLPQGWMVGSEHGVAGFLHPESVYDDPKGGDFRAALYPRLRSHFQFQNEKRLFPEVHHHTTFSVNVSGPRRTSPAFAHIANLYAPATPRRLLGPRRRRVGPRHQGRQGVDGTRRDTETASSRWTAKRSVSSRRCSKSLRVSPSKPGCQRSMPASWLVRYEHWPTTLFASPTSRADVAIFRQWHETISQRDGTIRRDTRFPERVQQRLRALWTRISSWAIRFNKTPRLVLRLSTVTTMCWISLTLPDEYLPRTNYVPACHSCTPTWTPNTARLLDGSRR